jgi:hypothetical protein
MEAKDFWKSLKFSNQNKDGSLFMSNERVEAIDKMFKQEPKLINICVKKVALIKCKVQVTPNHSEIVWAESLAEAPEIAWRQIGEGYHYGYTKESFLKKVTVTEVE